MTLRVISYGGGVQSTALLVLAAQGRIDFPVFLFANVGDDSEHPATIEYVHDVAMPYAAEHGVEVHELKRRKRDGSVETLWGRLMTPGSRSEGIPVRMPNGAPGNRSCTADFKIRVVGRWLREHGAQAGASCKPHRAELLGRALAAGREEKSASRLARYTTEPDCPDCRQPSLATVGIGISVDEIHRANARRVEPHEEVVYPLLDLGLRRTDCMAVITDAGLPVPHKSACYFCPFHRPAVWADLLRDRPDLFDRACTLEETLNARREVRGVHSVYLTRFNMPLRDAVNADQLVLFDDEGLCDSGWCMT